MPSSRSSMARKTREQVWRDWIRSVRRRCAGAWPSGRPTSRSRAWSRVARAAGAGQRRAGGHVEQLAAGTGHLEERQDCDRLRGADRCGGGGAGLPARAAEALSAMPATAPA